MERDRDIDKRRCSEIEADREMVGQRPSVRKRETRIPRGVLRETETESELQQEVRASHTHTHICRHLRGAKTDRQMERLQQEQWGTWGGVPSESPLASSWPEWPSVLCGGPGVTPRWAAGPQVRDCALPVWVCVCDSACVRLCACAIWMWLSVLVPV